MDWERASKLLNEDLSNKIIKTRSGGGGKQLSYIDHFEAIDAANRIFGHGGWSRETLENRQVSDKPVAYIARVRITVGNVIRDGCGYGNGFGNDAHELAWKEAETDATKRALMTFGYPLGLALYQKDGMEHVSDDLDEKPDTRIRPQEFSTVPGDLSAAKSKKSWATIDAEMKAQKSPAELNKWWFDNKKTIWGSLNNEFFWTLYIRMLERGADLSKSKFELDVFWSLHEDGLKALKKENYVKHAEVEEYMLTKVAKLMGGTLEVVNAG